MLSIAPTLIQPLSQRVIVLSDHTHLLGYFCEFRFNPLHLGLLGLEHSLKRFEFLLGRLLLKLTLIGFQLINSPSEPADGIFEH